MPGTPDRISALEQHVARFPVNSERLDQVAIDAAAARHLGAAVDRDVADLGRKVTGLGRKVDGLDAKVDGLGVRVEDLGVKADANRRAINELGVQTAERFQAVDNRFDSLEAKVDAGFAEMRGKFDGVAAGLTVIGEAIGRIEHRGRDEDE